MNVLILIDHVAKDQMLAPVVNATTTPSECIPSSTALTRHIEGIYRASLSFFFQNA